MTKEDLTNEEYRQVLRGLKMGTFTSIAGEVGRLKGLLKLEREGEDKTPDCPKCGKEMIANPTNDPSAYDCRPCNHFIPIPKEGGE